MKDGKKYRVPAKGRFSLKKFSANDRGNFKNKADAIAVLKQDQEKLNELQEVLYAESKHAVLVVLQALDTGGKDGTIRHVLGPLNPQGVKVTSFKKPTAEELAHDYLWRIHKAVPKRGMIGIFNRSHYEDVLVAKVHKLAPAKELNKRYEQINRFEQHLSANGVTIVKFYLHITRDEQAERLQDRLDRPDKHWKFDPNDLKERAHWDTYMKVYEEALKKCSTASAPWYVIPANRKWYRNFLVGRILRQTIEGLKCKYPEPPDGIEDFVVQE